MSQERRGDGGPDAVQHGPIDEEDARYAERVAEHNAWPIGDTNSGTGTLEPTDDVGTGGQSDIAGARDFGDTSSIRTGHHGVGGTLGTRLGDIGPTTGASGLTQEERGGLDALAGQPAPPIEHEPLDRARVDRAEANVDADAAGSLNQSAVQAAGFPGQVQPGTPGTADLGAAAGGDLGSGLGGTRGESRQPTRGEVSGIGGTRGSGGGTGHLEDTPGPSTDTPG
jgi:hypothetical protein